MDLVPLAQALTSNLPNEHEISLRLAAGSVVLSGRVSTAQAAEAAQRLAQAFMAPGTSSVASGTPNNAPNSAPNNTPLASAAVSQDITRVINLLEVRDAQQVLLDVRIAEVSKSLLDKLGLGVQASSGSGSGSNITLQEREFGVGLKFVPTVVDAGRVNLKVATSVQLLDGQALVIGGLIRNNSTATVSAFPVLGELPVLGALFRSTQFTSDQTELVVVVRASLVKPGARDAPPAATSP